MKQYKDNCAEIENSLPLFVGGDLEEPAALEVAGHLAGCSVCAERERSARSARGRLVSALTSSERKGPDLWDGVRAGLVREGVLQPRGEPAAPLARKSIAVRVRAWHYAAAAALVVIGVVLARDAFDSGAPYGPRLDPRSNAGLVENTPIAHPRVVETLPVTLPVGPNPLAANVETLRRVDRSERRLREGAEIYSDLPLDQGFETLDERTTMPVVLKH